MFTRILRLLGGPKVYDVTKYLNDHPGGPEIIMDFAGEFDILFLKGQSGLRSSLIYRQGC